MLRHGPDFILDFLKQLRLCFYSLVHSRQRRSFDLRFQRVIQPQLAKQFRGLRTRLAGEPHFRRHTGVAKGTTLSLLEAVSGVVCSRGSVRMERSHAAPRGTCVATLYHAHAYETAELHDAQQFLLVLQLQDRVAGNCVRYSALGLPN